MKKTGIFILAAMMIFAFSFGEMGQAFAAHTGKADAKDLKSFVKGERAGSEYMQNAALVMFKATKKKVTKNQAKKTLSTGRNSADDISVKSLWTFSPEPELVSDSSGKRKLVRANDGGREYVRVALVKSSTMSTDELVKTFNKRSDVKYAQPNYKVTAQSVSNDEYSDYQWSMQGSESKPSTVAPNIWSQWKKASGSDNIVAVVDTGVDYNHPDLKDNMWENDHYPALKGECGYDFINGDDDPMDDNDHGTHCAGIIGATGDNTIGISGANKKIQIMALKTLNEDGEAFLSNEIAAYNYIDKALDLGEPVKAINNSWGGGSGNFIFGELVDIVGEKGAITVAAAGNSETDCDKRSEYPVSINSPYMITVAANRTDGKLAGFSNYGRKTIDTAAPGTDILSTVAKGCYNPTIYGARQSDYSVRFNDYESAGGWADVNTLKNSTYLNGEKITPGEGAGADIKLISADEGFNPKGNSDAGKSAYLETSNMEAGDLICLTIPYEITQATKTAPYFSIMLKRQGTPDEGSLFGIIETEQGSDLSLDTIAGKRLKSGVYLSESDFDHWSHLSVQALDEEELRDVKDDAADGSADYDPLKRQIVLLIYSGEGGSAKVCIDDIGLSIENYKDMDVFGKYDFMSGTSMATPYVSGAVALKAAELEAGTNEAVDPDTLLNEVVSMTRSDNDIPVKQKGSLDFTRRPAKLPPHAGKILVDHSSDTLSIFGSGLGSEGIKAEIGDDEDSLESADITGASDRKLTVKNKNWINNIKTVKVSDAEGRESFRRDVYMVNGKKSIDKKEFVEEAPSGGMTTDGKKIYWAENRMGIIYQMDPASRGNDEDEDGGDYLARVDPVKIFKINKKKNANYSMVFPSGLVYSNGNIYSTVEYGQSATYEQVEKFEDEDWIIIFGEESEEGVIYSGESRLICVSANKRGGKVKSLGKLPADLEKTADYTMAAYNGKLYFMGGYSYKKGSKGITDKVWIYDPKTGKWSAGPKLPEKRAGGKAIQSGSKLVYTMGYSEANAGKKIYDQKHPANLIFSGGKWKKSSVPESKGIEPLVLDNSVTRGGNHYMTSSCDISLVKDGVMFTGVPVADYGDLFTYKTAKDTFADTGYNFIQHINEEEISGIVVGDTLYGFSENMNMYEYECEMYRLPVKGGHVNVKTSSSKNGSIKGGGAYMPGNTADIQVRAKKNYRIKSLKLDGKAVSLKKNQTERKLTLKDLVKDRKVTASFEKYKFKVQAKKQGKGKVSGVGTYVRGKTAKIKVSAQKGWYIKSIKYGKKNIKVGKTAEKKTFRIKNIKKDVTVKVVFKKKK